jgi:ribonuclease HI
MDVGCLISDENHNIRLNYFPDEGRFDFADETFLTQKVRKNKLQLEKILRSAIKGNLKVGQSINCVFIEGFNFIKESDFNKIIRLDSRMGAFKITTSIEETPSIHKVYADGSYACETKQSGYGGFIENPEGYQEIFNQSFKTGSSNLMELLAVTEGLERLSMIDKIQVNTDSRYVIRGLVQWVHFWKHNNWQTAYGCQVKFAEQWKEASQLCDGKLIEFKWIKGHSGNEKQDFCHQLARESAVTPTKTGT